MPRRILLGRPALWAQLRGRQPAVQLQGGHPEGVSRLGLWVEHEEAADGADVACQGGVVRPQDGLPQQLGRVLGHPDREGRPVKHIRQGEVIGVRHDDGHAAEEENLNQAGALHLGAPHVLVEGRRFCGM